MGGEAGNMPPSSTAQIKLTFMKLCEALKETNSIRPRITVVKTSKRLGYYLKLRQDKELRAKSQK